MLFSVEQAFVEMDEKWAPVKTPVWEAITYWTELLSLCYGSRELVRLHKVHVDITVSER